MHENYDILFEQVYDAYYTGVYKYIYASVKDKWITEDILSTVFTNIYKHKGKIIGIEESKHWVFRIAHNCIIDYYRKNKKVIPIEEFLNRGEDEAGYDNILIKDEFKAIKKLIEQLPEQSKDMLYMRYYGGLKYREIAEATETSENTVKSVVTRALKKVKKMYDDRIGGEISERRKV